MSEKYSKTDLRHIAEDMIEDLRECEDGAVTTTGRLARDYGYDDMETFDLFDLHDALFRAAKANKIIYVDYMYCINDEKYVEKSVNGKCTLTSYARQHVDECCIKFKQKFKLTKTQGDFHFTRTMEGHMRIS